MRAATVIVGAIAVSSCLIALALVLTSGNDASTKQSSNPTAAKETTRVNPGNGAVDSPAVSGPVQCNVEVTVEGASCLLGKSVLAAFEDAGAGAGTVTAVDPQSDEEVTLECSGEAPTICAGNGVTVYLAPTEP